MSNYTSEDDVQVTFRVKRHLLDTFDQVAEQTQVSRAALIRMSMAEVVKAGTVKEMKSRC